MNEEGFPLLDLLKSGEGWLTLTYSDGNRVSFRTTLEIGFLSSLPGGNRSNMLYDLDRKVWRSLPEELWDTDELSIVVTVDRPQLSEVEEYANRFIQ